MVKNSVGKAFVCFKWIYLNQLLLQSDFFYVGTYIKDQVFIPFLLLDHFELIAQSN